MRHDALFIAGGCNCWLGSRLRTAADKTPTLSPNSNQRSGPTPSHLDPTRVKSLRILFTNQVV